MRTNQLRLLVISDTRMHMGTPHACMASLDSCSASMSICTFYVTVVRSMTLQVCCLRTNASLLLPQHKCGQGTFASILGSDVISFSSHGVEEAGAKRDRCCWARSRPTLSKRLYTFIFCFGSRTTQCKQVLRRGIHIRSICWPCLIVLLLLRPTCSLFLLLPGKRGCAGGNC